jgi:serine/threonine protein kinase/Tol biopolymer transport system component
MPLSTGTRLGPYVIEAALGAGGMGEVYKARDPRLDRIVAIKVLPSHHTDDPERQQRFDREAHAVAALSHPNICAIFDVGQDGGIAYLVMEFLDGETLAERLAAGGRATSGSRIGSEGSGGTAGPVPRTGRPLPIGETLGIAVQLANALAAAHKAGIVHRDLKPANVVLLRTGGSQHGAPQVKVLDFGLARIAGAAQAPEPQVTMAAPLTGVGTLVGTVPYMSPEQVEGRDVDTRSDIFSLGSVIYEMATGRRAFDAGSQAGVIAAILERQPEPITIVQPMTPPGLDRVVRACLAKAPDDRWQHASDIARQLTWLVAESESGVERGPSSGTTAPAETAAARRSIARSFGWPHVVAGVACLLLAADVAWRPPGRSAAALSSDSPTAVHMPLSVPGVAIDFVRVSPDGRTLAITGTREDGRSGTWIQRLAEGRADEMANLDADARMIGWSRDGSELAFRSSRGLVAIRLDGGLVRPLAPATGAAVTAWGERDLLAGSEAGIKGFAVGTGAARDLFTGLALRPRFLPDGRRFLYSSRADTSVQGNPDGLYLSSVDAPQNRRLVLAKRSSGVYADGHLLFVEDGTLFAQPFDLSRAELSGTATPVLDGVRYFHPNGAAAFDAGAGTIAYATPAPDDSPVWVDRRGAIIGKLGAMGLYNEPRVSPDGTRAVYSREDRRRGTGDVWLQDLARHTTVRLMNDEWSEAHLMWSPDGKTVAYGTDRDGPPDVYVLDVDAGTPPRKLFATKAVDYPQTWLPGGRLMVRTQTELVVVRPDGTTDDTIKNLPPRGEFVASPDGRWLAATVLENGENDVYVQPLGRPGVRVRVSSGGGSQPKWTRDGRWLYFKSNRRMMQAAVRAGETFASDPPVLVFTLDREIDEFDVSPDGQRFLVLRSPPSDFLPFRVLINWRAKIK